MYSSMPTRGLSCTSSGLCNINITERIRESPAWGRAAGSLYPGDR